MESYTIAGHLFVFLRLQIASRTETDLIWLVVEPTPVKNMTSSVGMK